MSLAKLGSAGSGYKQSHEAKRGLQVNRPEQRLVCGQEGHFRGGPPGHLKAPILFNIQVNDPEDSKQVGSRSVREHVGCCSLQGFWWGELAENDLEGRSLSPNTLRFSFEGKLWQLIV